MLVSGETNRQAEWRDELLRAGVRAKGGNIIQFTRVEPLAGTKYIQAEAETKEDSPKKLLVVFGPEHAPLRATHGRKCPAGSQGALKPDMLLFCAFQFDEEAAKDIDELTPAIAGMQLIKAQMNADMLTDDLRKKRSSNESFWLVGQPDVRIHKVEDGKIQVEVMGFDYYNPKTGNVESGGKKNIAMWMLIPITIIVPSSLLKCFSQWREQKTVGQNWLRTSKQKLMKKKLKHLKVQHHFHLKQVQQ